MSSHRKASIRELASAAYELEAGVAQGRLQRNAVDGIWQVGDQPLDRWLERYSGHEVVLIVASLDEDRPLETRTCGTCGREYVGARCPTCQEARLRLRGR